MSKYEERIAKAAAYCYGAGDTPLFYDAVQAIAWSYNKTRAEVLRDIDEKMGG